MRVNLGQGAFLEPDEGPRNTQWHKRIIHVRPIPNTRAGNYLDLECGHRSMAFGNLAHAGGVVLCEQCRNRGQRFIVKVQQPLSSNAPDPPALVYNQDRSLTQEFPMDGALRRMMGDDLKQYRWAYLEDGVLHLAERAEEQDW